MTEHWGWPQWVFVGLYVIGILIAAANDGTPKTGKHSLVLSVVGTAIGALILWCGGFWA